MSILWVCPQCDNNLILREEVRVVPILMSRPSRVCLVAITRLRFVSTYNIGNCTVVKADLCTVQPIIMAPIQVVELTGMLPELESNSRNTSANTATLVTMISRKSKGIMSYYGYQRIGSKGTANWPWMVSHMACEACAHVVNCIIEFG